MVTCQSANQLKTPANVSWAFKMVSVWFTRLHNHGEDCWSDSCPEDNHRHPSQGGEATNIHYQRSWQFTECCIQACQQKVEWKEKVLKENMHNQPREPQPYEDCQAKSIQEFGWTSQGIDWGWGQGIKSTTHRRVEEFGYSCHQRRLTWAKEKKNWTVAQWSKVLFSDESKFCISFVNQGPRVWRKGGEAHRPSCLKSSVKFLQSVMIWAAMSSAGVGPLCFLKTNVTAPVYQEIMEHYMLPSADQQKILISFSSRIWHLPTLPKAPKVG